MTITTDSYIPGTVDRFYEYFTIERQGDHLVLLDIEHDIVKEYFYEDKEALEIVLLIKFAEAAHNVDVFIYSLIKEQSAG